MLKTLLIKSIDKNIEYKSVALYGGNTYKQRRNSYGGKNVLDFFDSQTQEGLKKYEWNSKIYTKENQNKVN